MLNQWQRSVYNMLSHIMATERNLNDIPLLQYLFEFKTLMIRCPRRVGKTYLSNYLANQFDRSLIVTSERSHRDFYDKDLLVKDFISIVSEKGVKYDKKDLIIFDEYKPIPSTDSVVYGLNKLGALHSGTTIVGFTT